MLHVAYLPNIAAVPRPNSLPVFIMKQWVSRSLDNILWLPSEHRSSSVATYGNNVMFGCPSGRALFMKFVFSKFP
jgi:hypothetical protein